MSYVNLVTEQQRKSCGDEVVEYCQKQFRLQVVDPELVPVDLVQSTYRHKLPIDGFEWRYEPGALELEGLDWSESRHFAVYWSVDGGKDLVLKQKRLISAGDLKTSLSQSNEWNKSDEWSLEVITATDRTALPLGQSVAPSDRSIQGLERCKVEFILAVERRRAEEDGIVYVWEVGRLLHPTLTPDLQHSVVHIQASTPSILCSRLICEKKTTLSFSAAFGRFLKSPVADAKTLEAFLSQLPYPSLYPDASLWVSADPWKFLRAHTGFALEQQRALSLYVAKEETPDAEALEKGFAIAQLQDDRWTGLRQRLQNAISRPLGASECLVILRVDERTTLTLHFAETPSVEVVGHMWLSLPGRALLQDLQETSPVDSLLPAAEGLLTAEHANLPLPAYRGLNVSYRGQNGFVFAKAGKQQLRIQLFSGELLCLPVTSLSVLPKAGPDRSELKQLMPRPKPVVCFAVGSEGKLLSVENERRVFGTRRCYWPAYALFKNDALAVELPAVGLGPEERTVLTALLSELGAGRASELPVLTQAELEVLGACNASPVQTFEELFARSGCALEEDFRKQLSALHAWCEILFFSKRDLIVNTIWLAELLQEFYDSDTPVIDGFHPKLNGLPPSLKGPLMDVLASHRLVVECATQLPFSPGIFAPHLLRNPREEAWCVDFTAELRYRVRRRTAPETFVASALGLLPSFSSEDCACWVLDNRLRAVLHLPEYVTCYVEERPWDNDGADVTLGLVAPSAFIANFYKNRLVSAIRSNCSIEPASHGFEEPES